jgi:glycosyltransferase involved in cell wall biosynthesis
MRPRLLINAKWRTQSQVTGVQRYAQGLTDALDVEGIEYGTAQPTRSGRLAGLVWEQRALPRIARQADVLLCPANMAPTNLDSKVRLLTVIHCLRFKFHPQSYSKSFVRWYGHMIPKIIQRSNTVFTVSRHQVTEIESEYPHAIGKVHVLSPGLDSVFNPHHVRDIEAPHDPYLLFLGSGAPAKNLRSLIKAYAIEPSLPPLVLVGLTQQQADLICPMPLRSRIHALGHINEPSRIASLLANAQALVSPSLYESFGLPCLEAMGCGTPVVASDIPAHREVCSDSAVYVPPSEPLAWAQTLKALLDDQSRLDTLSKHGQKRSAHWSWSRSVESLRQVLDEPCRGRAT